MNNSGAMPRTWWLRWTFVTAFGWAIVTPIGWATIMFFNVTQAWGWYENYSYYDYKPWNVSSIFLLIPILLAAIAQGVLLRGRLKGFLWWILITSLGYYFSLMGFFGINGLFDIQYYGFVGRVLAGLILGGVFGVGPALLQFVFLYRNKLPKSGWWILVGTLSFSVSILLFHFVEDGGANTLSVFFGLVLVGAAFGIPTGILMQYLLGNAKTLESNLDQS